MPRLLVTGFEPFGGAADNPSGAIVRRLGADPAWQARAAFAVLPVTWTGARHLLVARADREEAAACLLFGLAASAAGLRVERCAYNLAEADLADNAGRVPPRAELVEGGAPRAATVVPVDALVAALAAEGVPVEPSDDPGRFVCNAVYYGALTAGRPWSARSLFVHVPATREIGGRFAEAEVERWVRAALAALTGA